LELPAEDYGRPKAETGHWASVIRVVDPFFQPPPDAEDGSEKPQRPESLLAIELDENEAAFSIAVVPFVEKNGELCLVVGTAVDVTLSPRTTSGGFLRVYKISQDGRSLEYMHKVSTCGPWGKASAYSDCALRRHLSMMFPQFSLGFKAISWPVLARR
jgi:splicing factor 3B subunit 3